MFRIPYIRAVIDDKRLTQTQIKALLAKTSLPPTTRSAVAKTSEVENFQCLSGLSPCTSAEGSGTTTCTRLRKQFRLPHQNVTVVVGAS